MTAVLRAIRLIALAVWVGGIVFFAFAVAKVAFSSMPDAHTAGLVVRGTLIELHKIGLASGGVYFFLTVALIALQRDTHPVRAVEIALIVAMISLTAYSQFSILPSMERDRMALGGDTTKAPFDDPTRSHFNRQHGLSVKLEGAVLIEGFILLALAPIHGRDELYMFA